MKKKKIGPSRGEEKKKRKKRAVMVPAQQQSEMEKKNEVSIIFASVHFVMKFNS
jgi:hypothetical protein